MNDNRIKVLQIIGNARLGGVASCLMNYFRFADTDKFRFDFATYGESPLDERVKEIDPSSRIFHIPSFEKNFFKSMREIGRVCRAEKYGIVHSHMTTLSAFALPPAAKAGVPVRICHAHSAFDKNSDRYLFKKILRPFAAKCATHLMACSAHAAKNLFRTRADEAFLLPNAIDGAHFACSAHEHFEAKRKCGLEGRTILFVGRFAFAKNLFFLLDAFALARRQRQMTLLLVGDGEHRPALENAVREKGLEQSVRLIPPADPAVWYKAADLFCLPSRYEGLGMAAIEAQAAGLPCIFSDAVPKEADISKKSIFLPLDEVRWADAMLKDRPRHPDGDKALLRAGYEIRKEAHLLTDFYEKALGERI